MRVAFATDGFFPHSVGGMQRHTTLLANALVDLDIEVDVYAPAGHEQGDQRFRVITLPWPGGRVYALTLHRWAQRLAPAIARESYDVVYTQGLSLGGRVPPTVAPTIFNPHGLEMFMPASAIDTAKGWPLRVAARREARVASRVISLGGRLTDIAVKGLGVPRERVAVVPNGVDTGYFQPDAAPRERGLLLFVGRFFRNKGIDLLLEAFARVAAPDARLVLVGSGPLRKSLEESVRDERVTFLGGVSEAELAALYRRADCVVVPSRSDGMPTVILEAFACGTPAVASDVGAVAELVDGDTGILLPSGDVPALTAALEQMVGLSDAAREAVGMAARAKAETRFAWPAVAARTAELLDEVARER